MRCIMNSDAALWLPLVTTGKRNVPSPSVHVIVIEFRVVHGECTLEEFLISSPPCIDWPNTVDCEVSSTYCERVPCLSAAWCGSVPFRRVTLILGVLPVNLLRKFDIACTAILANVILWRTLRSYNPRQSSSRAAWISPERPKLLIVAEI